MINRFKRLRPDLFVVGFKYEPQLGRQGLIIKGRRLLKKSNLDLVVANSDKKGVYRAYILAKRNKYGPFLSKASLAAHLAGLLKNKL